MRVLVDDEPKMAGPLPRAFDRFTRAADAHTGESTGLGLAIVAALAHRHGGTATPGVRVVRTFPAAR